jgi:hypothetical protein
MQLSSCAAHPSSWPSPLEGEKELCGTALAIDVIMRPIHQGRGDEGKSASWREYPEDESQQVSHETIYRSLFIQARGVLKKVLQQHPGTQRAIRRSKHASMKEDGHGQIY